MTQQPTQIELLAGLKRSATLIQALQKEVQDYHEPIAIIGMGCRFPGDANTPTAYWELLRAGRSTVSEAPRQRGQIDSGNGATITRMDKAPTYYGHYLREVGDFDAHFFSISPREAQWMDPQQQLLLEVSFEALEHANLPVDGLSGSRTGVYIGLMNQDYAALHQGADLDVYVATGSEASFIAGRLSYLLGLRGPSMIVGTACSSSLVTTHLACQALRAKECDLALSGGVSLILKPDSNVILAKMQATAPDGVSKTFDAAANGYGRGEGCGVLVLKRLSDAQRDGDTVWALIRGSAVNHDGRSGGLTVPSGPAQEELLRQALATARINAHQVSYVEAHGTGTSLGDPIEMRALGNVLCQARQIPLLVGSTKTNIGHLESAAGVAGLMKVILALHHKQIPPHLHFHRPNPHIPWDYYPIEVPTTLTEWHTDGPRVAGVSSFGLSGINAHVILEEAPATPERIVTETRPRHLLTLSAKTPQALHELAQHYQDWLAQPNTALGDLCYTSHVGRSHYAYRLGLVGASIAEIQTQLATYLEEPAGSHALQAIAGEQAPRIAFLFTGQGAQYVHMARELYTTSLTFRATLEHYDALLCAHLGESLLNVLYPAASDQSPMTENPASQRIDDTTYTQPALFVLEYALATLWQAWGIQPDVLIGHSIGEVAAACVAGIFSLEDGLKLVAARGRLMGALPQDGEMVSLLTSEARVRHAIAGYQKDVSIAAVNGPESIVIAGKREAVLAIAAQLAADGVKTRRLMVSHAFHSPLMEPMLAAFRQVAQTITYHKPKLRMVSNVTGKLAGDEIATPEYWVRHVRDTVRFADGIATLREQGATLFLEIGPKPVLLGMADQPTGNAQASASRYLASLRAGQSDWQQLLISLGELYVCGVAIDWQGFDRDYQRRKVVLPTYPFQRQRYWSETKSTQALAPAATDGFAQWLATHNIDQLTDWVTNKGNFNTEERSMVTRVLTTLDTANQAQQREAQVATMLYEVAWEAQTKPLPLTPPTTPGRWLLLTDGQGVGDALAAALRTLGEQVETVPVTSDWRSLTTHLTTTYLTTTTSDALPLRGVVQLWGLDTETAKSAHLLHAQEQNLGSVLQLVQGLAAQPNQQARLWVITQGAQQLAAAEVVAVAQTPLWGLGRVIGLEHSELWGGLIDLEPTTEPGVAAQALLAELLQPQPTGETQVAYRKGIRHVARLVQGKLNKRDQAPAIHTDAVYLVTGGLGALGLLVAQWLAEQGARHLILTSRRGITNEAQQTAVDALTTQGVTVQVAQVDVADATAMHQLFAQTQAGSVPLKGVFHTAGVLGDGLLLNQSWDRFATVLAAKVTGSWLLHELTRDLALDFLVFFSSVAALLGNLGQGNYAAANAFLDGLARYRRQQGLPGLSINWGPWADAGMAARTTQVKLDRAQLITAETGMTALTQVLAQGKDAPAQIGVAPIDWQQFDLNDNPSPFLRHFVKPQTAAAVKPTLLAELTALPSNQRLSHLRTYLQQTVGRVLGMADLPDRAVGFTDLGMDSLMALELRRQLERAVGQALPTTLAFEYPTIEQLAAYLLACLEMGDQRSETGDQAPVASPPALNEPIAVISMACRFPGATSPEAFWQLLCDGVDTIREIATSRWSIDAYYDPHRPTPGKMYTRHAAFIERVDQFDPLFFGIAPREATGMDPMHRLLLEVSWEALERAGLAQSRLVDSQTGVFVGIGPSDYIFLQGVQDFDQLDTHTATSSGHSVAAGRLAYTLGLQGPALAVDTACSSSLVALHLACQSLRTGECDLALTGGMQLLLSPLSHIALSQMNALSPDGRCKTFDAAADGYGRGEGGAMVLLKRLSAAEADGDEILAVIRGSAVNHDGPSSGLTVPNKRAQEKLLRQALANAGVMPDEVAYIEAHGTGTPLGDPIEIRALGAVFGHERSQPLLVGSVKTNVGHLEAAAGIVGFVKTVLALQHGQIPPHLHFHTPNPYIEWDEFTIQVPTTVQPWPTDQRIAGISSFGISGTNAHVVVTAAPPQGKESTAAQPQEQDWYFLPLSAKHPAALPELAKRYHAHLYAQPTLALADLCYTAAVGRNHFNHRLGLVAKDRTELLTKLAAVGAGEAVPGGVRGSVSQNTPCIAFLFTGQGAQYLHMGATLYQTEPVFRAVIDRCDVVAQTVLGRSLLKLIYPTEPPTHTDLIDSHPCGQAVNFAVECALVELWKAWGVRPAYVLGHSLGDFAAAYAAGVLSLEDGLRLVSERGRLMETAVGAMVSVMAAEAEVAPFVAAYADVVIGVINGPRSVVISGGHEHVAAAEAALQAAGIKTRRVAVPMAAHSPLLDPVLAEFEALVRDTVTLHPPQLPVVSSMTGQLVSTELTDPSYWRQHLRNPVRFADGVATLAAEGCTLFIEIGPKPTLLGVVGQIVAETPQLALLPALHHEHDARQQMLTVLAELYTRGVDGNWAVLYNAKARRKVVLPTYPFQRQRYWLATPKTQPKVQGVRPLIDKLTRLPLHNEQVFETTFSTETLPFLADHRVYDMVVSPGACQLVMALSAVEVALGQSSVQLTDVVFPEAFVLPEGSERTAQLVLTPTPANGSGPHQALKLISFADEAAPTTHAIGQAAINGAMRPALVDLTALRARCSQAVDVPTFYAEAAANHLGFGPSFRWISELWRGDGEALSKLLPPASLATPNGYPLHPALLDGCFQTAGVARRTDDAPPTHEAVMPFAVGSLAFYSAATGQEWWCHAVQTGERTWDITLLDSQGAVLTTVKGFVVRAAPATAVRGKAVWRDWLYEVAWPAEPLASTMTNTAASANGGRHWLILADVTGIGSALANELRSAGDAVTLVQTGAVYQASADGCGRIRPAVAADYQQMLADLPPLTDVVHLWSLDIPTLTAPDHTAADLEAAAQQSVGALLHLSQALLSRPGDPPRLWLVTQNAQAVAANDAVTGVAQAYLWGMGRVIALEHPEFRTVRIDLDGCTPSAAQAPLLAQELRQAPATIPAEDQIAFRHGQRHVARLVRYQASPPAELPASPYRVEIAARGTIDNLVLQPLTRRAPGLGEVEIRVQAAGLNFRNVLDVLGLLPYSLGDALGDECAGEVVAVGPGVTNCQVGDRVVAIAYASFSHYVTTNSTLVARLPDNLSYPAAASIPINFLTAYYGLHQLAHIKPGDKVLIHAATGGTGMAAVQIAQAAGAEVYGTASPSKWDTLRLMGVQHVYNSRTLDFADAILTDTNGQGVNIVFNSLTGEGFVEQSLRTLAPGGRFIEIARRSIWSDDKVAALRSDITYHLVDFSQTIPQESALIGALLVKVLALFANATLTPTPHLLFPLHQVVDAFRHMQNARHVGKVLLIPAPEQPATPNVALHADATYLITGGLGGIGLLVAERFVTEGARHLILLGRSAPKPETVEKLAELRQQGAAITVLQVDITHREQVAAVLASIDPAQPLRGIVHSVGVLDDGALVQQSWPRFTKVLAPKVWGTWHLHCLTRGLDLDFFSLFAAGAGLLGNRGQANHAAANTFLDAFAHYRRAQGLPAQSIDWGAWAEVGAAADLVRRGGAQLAASGMGAIPPQAGIDAYLYLLHQPVSQVGVLPIDWLRYGGNQPFYRALSRAMQQTPPSIETATPLPEQLAAAPLDERFDLIVAYVQEQVARVLGFADATYVPTTEGVTDLGMDSLTAIELRNRLQTGLKAKLPATLVFDYPTIEALAGYLADQLFTAFLAVPEGADDTGGAEDQAAPVLAPLGILSNSAASHDLVIDGQSVTENDPVEALETDDVVARLAAKLGLSSLREPAGA